MTLRTLFLATSALFLSAGVVSTSAEAATHHARRHMMMGHHTAMRGHMGRGMAMRGSRGGGDAQNSTVDQLNAQSLAAARGGAAPVAQ